MGGLTEWVGVYGVGGVVYWVGGWGCSVVYLWSVVGGFVVLFPDCRDHTCHTRPHGQHTDRARSKMRRVDS